MRTNKIRDSKIDYVALVSKYSFYRFVCKGYRQRANICDRLKAQAPVEAIRNSAHDEEYEVHVMAIAGDDVEESIRRIGTTEESSKGNVIFDKVNPHDLSPSVLLQLMLSSINKNEIGYGPSNASGNFYLIVNEKFNQEKGIITEIVALEFRIIDRDYLGTGMTDAYLSVQVRTFTNYKLKEFIHFTKKNPPESYPQYVKDGACIRRHTSSDEGDTFILRRMGKKKSKVDYFSFQDYEKMSKTKVWLISEVQEVFNLKFSGIAKLEFSDEDVTSTIRPNGPVKKREYESRIDAILKMKPVRIINEAGDDGSDIALAIANRFSKRGYKVINDDEKDCFVVDIIHNNDYYDDKGLEDQHINNAKYALQHVTVEDFKMSTSAIDVVATNLAIKADLVSRKITVGDWHHGKLIFAIKLDDAVDMSAQYALMKVDAEGNISFCRRVAREETIMRLGSAMMSKEVVGAVVMGNDVNVIHNTEIFTVPNIKIIRSKMKDNETKGIGLGTGLRGIGEREDFFPEMIDINSIRIGNERMLYAVGSVGYGVSSSIPRAVRIRSVEAWEGSSLFFEGILDLMDVFFVKHKQLTVIPYPFKYLREWCYLNGWLEIEGDYNSDEWNEDEYEK